MVGVSEYCRYPEAARRKPRIGSYLAPNPEVILAMRPDIVFVEEVNARALAMLPAVGFRKVELRHRSIEDVYKSIDIIANAAGSPLPVPGCGGNCRRSLAASNANPRSPKRRVLFWSAAIRARCKG